MAHLSDHSDRDKLQRIARLKRRAEKLRAPLTADDVNALLAVVKGTLDLLADEL